MENSEKIWHLIARSLNQEATPGEVEELMLLLREDAVIQQQFELLTRIWHESTDEAGNAEQAERSVNRIIDRVNSEAGNAVTDPALTQQPFSTHRKRRRTRRLIFAAFAGMLVAGSWFLLSGKNVSPSIHGKDQPIRLLVAQNGSRSRSLLPDGTTVWLNAGSTLHIDDDLSGPTREVRLEGEAYFDVAKRNGRPFIVHTSGFNIKVLGTVFNVKAYPGDGDFETTLFNGSVNVFRQDKDESTAIHLRPNQKLIIPASATGNQPATEQKPGSQQLKPMFTILSIDSTRPEEQRYETAWLYSRLEFRGDDFETLARKLERWYNIRIVFSDDKVKHLNFNGSFEKETVEQAFVAMQAAVPLFRYIINNHEITVSSGEHAAN